VWNWIPRDVTRTINGLRTGEVVISNHMLQSIRIVKRTPQFRRYEAEVLAEAEAILSSSDTGPAYVRRLHLRGLLGIHDRANGLALVCLRLAAQLEAQNPSYLADLGVALANREQGSSAVNVFCQAVRLKPDDPDLYSRFGDMLVKLRLYREAAAMYSESSRLDSSSIHPYVALGDLLRLTGKHDQAISCYDAALSVRPSHVPSRVRKGEVQLGRRQWSEALATFRGGLCSTTGDPELHEGAGIALYHLRAFAEAVEELLVAIRGGPSNVRAHRYLVCAIEMLHRHAESVGAWCNLGAVLKRRDRFEDAAVAYDQALTRKPDCLRALIASGQICLELARPADAVPRFEAALQLVPTHTAAHVGLASALLLTGHETRGWQHFKFYRNSLYDTDFEQPVWTGSPIHDHTIALWADQGLGDAIQYARYLPLVKALAKRVVLVCQPQLRSLMEYAFTLDAVVLRQDPLPTFDVHAPLFSLPRIFLECGIPIPKDVPYLTVDPQHHERWYKPLGTRQRPVVGLVWGSQATYYRARFKSIPLAQLRPLTSLRGVKFVSLQLGPQTSELAGSGLRVEQLIDESCDIADTAAAIVNLDLVISVDTMVAHLAGALGKPVWMFVPFSPDWRWRLTGHESLWYPTMWLFRQNALGEWRDVVEAVAAELECQVASIANT
jgi:tetratricopeptide (TPR) repeat protein